MIYLNSDLFYNKSLNSNSVGVVPHRDIINFASDLFLGVWRSIFSLAIYFRGRNALIRRDKSPRGRPAEMKKNGKITCKRNQTYGILMPPKHTKMSLDIYHPDNDPFPEKIHDIA